MVEKWFLNDGKYLFVNGYNHEFNHFVISFLFISNDVLARFIRCKTCFLNQSLSHLKLYHILGKFIVTTQIDHVISAEPNSPHPRFSKTVRSSCNLQHIDLTAHGLYAFGFGTFIIFQFSSFCTLNCDHIKFWKYGIQYLAVISNNASTFGLSQSKSSVILYVGYIFRWVSYLSNPFPFVTLRISLDSINIVFITTLMIFLWDLLDKSNLMWYY